jgi:alpha-beta hydrolase superfamily lysophospholipase
MTPSEPVRFHLSSRDGLSIACVKWVGHHQSRGVVQIAHGLGEHMGRYAELAEILVRDQFAVYGNDHRGHGMTAAPSGQFGDFGTGGFDQLVEDMVSLRVIAKDEHAGTPYFLLGQGMGSFAAQQLILDHSHSINGLILSGSGVLDGLARIAQNLSVADEWTRLMNAPFEPTRTPFDWLSRDDAEVDAFIDDPLCFASLVPSSMAAFLDAFPRLADPKEIRNVRSDLPMYLFSGSDDPVGQRLAGVQALADRYLGAGMESIAHEFYPGGRHEMLHELNRREVFADLLVWIAGVMGSSQEPLRTSR